MKAFDGKVVLITGASSGIGRASALEFARQGAAVVLLARRIPRLKAVVDEIRGTGSEALAIRCDVTVDGDIEKAIAVVHKQLGPVYVVLANAGFEVTGSFDKLTLEDYRRQFETNVFGVLRTVFATLDDLKTTRGSLVLIGSLLGHIVLPATTAYSMSKFAVTALAEGLRRELRSYGISVVLITPGNVETEIRKIDNHDIFHPELKDPIPEWLRIRADQAAKQIVAAVVRHRPEAVITRIGKLAVFTKRHVPKLVSLAIDLGHLRGRSEPSCSKDRSKTKRAGKTPAT